LARPEVYAEQDAEIWRRVEGKGEEVFSNSGERVVEKEKDGVVGVERV